jgi:hypothetical protein
MANKIRPSYQAKVDLHNAILKWVRTLEPVDSGAFTQVNDVISSK